MKTTFKKNRGNKILKKMKKHGKIMQKHTGENGKGEQLKNGCIN
jgi:hypothetical protein